MEKNVKTKPVDGATVIDKVIEAILIVFGIVCLIAGVFSGKWHCFLIACMSFALVWAFKVEDRKNG